MPSAQELGKVKAELERLRASLREHGIEPVTTLHRHCDGHSLLEHGCALVLLTGTAGPASDRDR